MNMNDLLGVLREALGYTLFPVGRSFMSVGCLLSLLLAALVFIFVVKKIHSRCILPVLERFQLRGSLIEYLSYLFHIILFVLFSIIVLDRTDLDLNAAQMFETVQSIMSESLIPIGNAKVTLWTIIYVLTLSALMIGLSGRFQRWMVETVFKPTSMELGVKYGISMMVKYALVAIGFLAIIQSAGIDLSSLAILAGALGLGLSFGLQHIVANFVSGFTILLEQPVKVGDRVEIDGVLGNVTDIKLRSTTITTNDNIEIIIPNSEFITEKVINLSHSSKVVRFRFPFGVSYNSDPHKVKSIVESLVSDIPGILSSPAPNVVFKNFGDSALEFELRVWTRKHLKSPDNLRSDVLFAIFDAFKTEGIEIPYPQRDMHIKSVAPLTMVARETAPDQQSDS